MVSPTKDGMQTSFCKENYLKMTEKEIDFVCDWIGHHITWYIGWNEWGSLRVTASDRLKEALKKTLAEQ